jgi:hypothetical protein
MAMRRILTEYRLRTVLAHGGMVAPVRQVFLAYRGRDTRRQVAGWVSPHIIGRLRSQACLQARDAFPDRLEAGPPPVLDIAPHAMRRPSDLVNLRAGPRRSLLAELLPEATSPQTILQRAAIGRYRDEFVRASQPAVARARPVFGDPPEPPASMRLAGLEAGIGIDVMRQLEDVLIDRATVSALTVRWRMDAGDVKAAARDALSRLTAAYELSSSVDSAA